MDEGLKISPYSRFRSRGGWVEGVCRHAVAHQTRRPLDIGGSRGRLHHQDRRPDPDHGAAPGTGTIQIVLMPTNLTMTTQNGKPMLLKGATFQAIFNVTSPAMQPTPVGPIPDPVMVKPCTAQFITTNTTVQAS